MEIKPVTFKEASNFINLYHRHHNATVGCKFCIGLYDNAKLIGCAVCGRPVSRYYDNGEICEINRVCVLDGYKKLNTVSGKKSETPTGNLKDGFILSVVER